MSWISGPPQFPGAPAAQADHVCPLQPVTDDEATLALVEASRHASSASAVVARLRQRGLGLGRRSG